MINFVITGTDH